MKKYAIFIMLLFAILVFASGCIDDNSTNQTSKSTIPSKTFSSGGVSFDYPESWNKYTADQLTFDVGSQAEALGGVGTSDGSVLAVAQKIPTQGSSLDAFQSAMETAIKSAGTIDSSQSITTNGQTGFEIVYTLNSGKKERINGYTDGTNFYSITMSTSESNYDSQKENFDLIANSFKF